MPTRRVARVGRKKDCHQKDRRKDGRVMLQSSEISAAIFAGRRMFPSVATSFPAFKFRDSFSAAAAHRSCEAFASGGKIYASSRPHMAADEG
jgi:hypothetical protein